MAKPINYITTVTGEHFNFLNPVCEQVHIKDIAYSLANQCRFNGHIPFFSVAEHCVAVAARLPVRLQLAGLLHDASEAYLSDIPSPIKQYLPDYCAMEDNVQDIINATFKISLSPEEKAELKQADLNATYTEAISLMGEGARSWVPILFQPEEAFQPRCLPPPEAFKMFMFWFSELTSSTVEQQLIVVKG